MSNRYTGWRLQPSSSSDETAAQPLLSPLHLEYGNRGDLRECNQSVCRSRANLALAGAVVSEPFHLRVVLPIDSLLLDFMRSSRNIHVIFVMQGIDVELGTLPPPLAKKPQRGWVPLILRLHLCLSNFSIVARSTEVSASKFDRPLDLGGWYCWVIK